MLRNLILAATLAILPTTALAQSYPVPGQFPPQPQGVRYWVQFRQNDWRERYFIYRDQMEEFVAGQQRNNWEVQVLPTRRGEFFVRFRLTQWGGSQIFNTVGEAQRYADYLRAHDGYETRIVERTW